MKVIKMTVNTIHESAITRLLDREEEERKAEHELHDRIFNARNVGAAITLGTVALLYLLLLGVIKIHHATIIGIELLACLTVWHWARSGFLKLASRFLHLHSH